MPDTSSAHQVQPAPPHDRLPWDLQALVDRVHQEAHPFGDRDVTLASLRAWIARGDFDMARSVAASIVERQSMQRLIEAEGLPVDLRGKLEQIESGKFEYPERQDDLARIHRWLAKADIEMARVSAATVIERQSALRMMTYRGLPSDLVAILDEVAANEIEFPDRQSSVERLSAWLSRGDFQMARCVANTLCARQKTLRMVAQHGLPGELQDLLEQVDAGQCDYPGRSDALGRLRASLANGDHSHATTIATMVITQQRALRRAKDHGLPVDLQALLAQIEEEKVAYLQRDAQETSLKRWLACGDMAMARYCANDMIKRQRNIRLMQVPQYPAFR